MTTKNEEAQESVVTLLRSRATLLWVVSREEARVEAALIEAAASARYETTLWDVADGLTEPGGEKATVYGNSDPSAALDWLKAKEDRRVLIMRDLHKWLEPSLLRKLRNLARAFQNAPAKEARTIVVLSPSGEVPPELADHTAVIDWPRPERGEIAAILDNALGQLSKDAREKAELSPAERERAIDAAVGLTAEEAASCYSKSLISLKRIDPVNVALEKKSVINREKVLTWYDPDPRGLEAVGGLGVLKKWLTERRAAFSPEARAYGLPAPRGVAVCGVPGTGKSLTAKCVAASWGIPLLRLDIGSLRSKYVGDSEQNVRRALATAEAVGSCVLWVDEIEKALGGSTGPQGDGGVAADALGALLSWMQERQGSVFVIASMNDPTGLPPELLRKGRFDELFFVDLPTTSERVEVLQVTLTKFGRGLTEVDVQAVARATAGFSGAELAAIVPDAMFTAFADGARGLRTEDLLAVAAEAVPLSKTAGEKLEALRTWAKGRARMASLPETTAKGSGRALDM